MHTKIVAVLAALTLAVAGCSSDDSSENSDDETTTTVTDGSSTNDEFDLEAALAVAEGALLRLEDMPTGWAEERDDEDEDNERFNNAFADCLGIDVEELASDNESVSSSFTDGDDLTIGSEITPLPDLDDALERYERRVSDEGLACSDDAITEGLALEFAAEDVELEGSNVSRLNLDLPDGAEAFRIQLDLSSQGFSVSVYADTVTGIIDSYGYTVTAESTFSPPDPEETARYAKVVADRLAEATGGTPNGNAGDSADETEDEPVATGSRTSPIPFGETAALPDWDVTVLSFTADGSEIVAAEEFNDPAPEGQSYAILRVRATYTGEDSGSPAFDLGFDVVGDDQRRYTSSDCAVELSILPEALYDEPEVFGGGTVEGNVCVLIPVGLSDMALAVSDQSAFDEDPIWMALS